MKPPTLTLSLAGLLMTTTFSHAELKLYDTRIAWTAAVGEVTTAPILTQSFDGTDTEDTDIPVGKDTFDIFGNFSVYYETRGEVDDTFFDYAFDSSTDIPLDLGIDISGTDWTSTLEFRFAAPQAAFAADFASVDVGEGLTIIMFNGTTPTGESVNLDEILTPTDGDGFIGFTTDLPFTSFAFSPLSETSMIFNLDEVSTAEAVEKPTVAVPLIDSTSFNEGTFRFRVPTSDPGQLYQIQSSAGLTPAQWIDTGNIVNGTGGPLVFEVVAPAADTRHYYRVKVSSP
ncbi:MAG: hypothetical protein ACSHYF_02610 [Verrucomicrobiaceae bacterium]